MNPQNTASRNHPLELRGYAAVIGIACADQKYASATLVLPLENQAPELSTLEQKTEAHIDWIGRLQQRFVWGHIAIAIEQRKRALISFLSGFDFIDIYPIEPLSLRPPDPFL